MCVLKRAEAVPARRNITLLLRRVHFPHIRQVSLRKGHMRSSISIKVRDMLVWHICTKDSMYTAITEGWRKYRCGKRVNNPVYITHLLSTAYRITGRSHTLLAKNKA